MQLNTAHVNLSTDTDALQYNTIQPPGLSKQRKVKVLGVVVVVQITLQKESVYVSSRQRLITKSVTPTSDKTA